eukprot:scaffold99274_cov34-Attheya_sp.AAC.1
MLGFGRYVALVEEEDVKDEDEDDASHLVRRLVLRNGFMGSCRGRCGRCDDCNMYMCDQPDPTRRPMVAAGTCATIRQTTHRAVRHEQFLVLVGSW